jgi:hypothetical protein
MERPLLLLMTMDTAARNRLAVTLGFSLVHKPFFGQAAAEAAQLLFRKQQGVQVRAQRAPRLFRVIAVLRRSRQADSDEDCASLSHPAGFQTPAVGLRCWCTRS